MKESCLPNQQMKSKITAKLRRIVRPPPRSLLKEKPANHVLARLVPFFVPLRNLPVHVINGPLFQYQRVQPSISQWCLCAFDD
jgi:hypothetical protein